MVSGVWAEVSLGGGVVGTDGLDGGAGAWRVRKYGAAMMECAEAWWEALALGAWSGIGASLLLVMVKQRIRRQVSDADLSVRAFLLQEDINRMK